MEKGPNMENKFSKKDLEKDKKESGNEEIFSSKEEADIKFKEVYKIMSEYFVESDYESSFADKINITFLKRDGTTVNGILGEYDTYGEGEGLTLDVATTKEDGTYDGYITIGDINIYFDEKAKKYKFNTDVDKFLERMRDMDFIKQKNLAN